MTTLLPPADHFVSINAATFKAFGAESVKVTAPDTVEVSFSSLTDRANADAVFNHAVHGTKVLFTTTDHREIAPVVDARSAAAFLKQHPGVTDVVGFQMDADHFLVVPGTTDGPTDAALNSILDAGNTDKPVLVASARPADATPSTPYKDGVVPPSVPLA